ncbi:MFS transporter [Candidatus Bathyarchaeota archaeon]|jgi:MFS family permease|nr:MFS transporter [Candidatus Bathyarchaeota archaeon]
MGDTGNATGAGPAKAASSENSQGMRPLRNVYVLGLVSLLTDISSEMVFSVLPTFLLGLPGSSVEILGLIEGAAEALSYALRSVSGIFSDMFRKRKLLVLIGYGLSTIVKPLFAVARSATDILVVRVADRVGKAVRTSPRDALLSDSVPAEKRGLAFGIHRTLDQSGAIIGPALASGLMLFVGLNVRDVFWLSFIPGTIALIVLILLVQERVGKGKGEYRLLQGMRIVLKGRFLVLLALVGLFSLGAFNFSFILVYAKEAGVGDSIIPLVYMVINVAHTLVAIPSGILSDRIGRERTLLIGYGLFLSVTLLILFSSVSLSSALSIAVVFGAYAGIVETVQRALVPGYAESSLRGTAYGLYYLVVGLAFFGSNAVVGALWGLMGPRASATYSAALTTAAMVGMMLFTGRGKTVPTTRPEIH